jgi:hypothetical protein
VPVSDSLAARQARLRNRLSAIDRPVAALPLARAVYGPPDDEALCEVYQQALPSFVNAELAGVTTSSAVMSAIKRHLAGCSRCTAIYVGLLETGMAQMRGEPPRPRSARAPDLSFLD